MSVSTSVGDATVRSETSPEFVPVLIRQRDHVADHDQTDRARLFANLLDITT